jgi:hypothetical protein
MTLATMSGPDTAGSKRQRDKYSRLICLGCRDRRIRCELPSDVDIPKPGELRTCKTPCYRCRRLGVPCVIRQTVLGRPGREIRSITPAVSPIFIELPTEASEPNDVREERAPPNSSVVPLTKLCSTRNLQLNQAHPVRWDGGALLVHTPHSPETVLTIRAIDTLRYEGVEQEWFRHLPPYTGHTLALDLSVKALVAACAYKRGTPRITSGDCYQALALALNAVQTSIMQSNGETNDAMLASTALLARFDGEVKKNAIPTRLHVEGLAAILKARPPTYQVTQIARDILDFHAGESAIMACVQETASPFENVARAYFATDIMGYNESDRTQLKALSNEIFIGLPRLVGFVRSLRLQPSPDNHLLSDALKLLESLLELQDAQAEERLLQDVEVHSSSEATAASPLGVSLHFAAYKDFEALTYYWQSRLSLLRLEKRLQDLSVSSNAQADITYKPGVFFRPSLRPSTDEMLRLAKNILKCSEYATTLGLNKHTRLFSHALVVVWGTTMDIAAHCSHQDAKGTGLLTDLLLRRMNIARREKPYFTAEDMDIAADIFVGGPPKGRFAKRFGL